MHMHAMHAYACTCSHTHAYVRIRTHTFAYLRILMPHAYAHIRTHTHAHARIRISSPSCANSLSIRILERYTWRSLRLPWKRSTNCCCSAITSCSFLCFGNAIRATSIHRSSSDNCGVSDKSVRGCIARLCIFITITSHSLDLESNIKGGSHRTDVITDVNGQEHLAV